MEIEGYFRTRNCFSNSLRSLSALNGRKFTEQIFFAVSTLTGYCSGVWPPRPLGRASIIAARMDASRNRRNANLWCAGTPANGGTVQRRFPSIPLYKYRELKDFGIEEFWRTRNSFKFATLFVDAEQTEVHGTEIFCRVNVNGALRRSLATNTLRTGIHYRCANGCVTEQTERQPMTCRNASLWRDRSAPIPFSSAI